MLRSLLYVSKSTLSLPEQGWQVEEIVKLSRHFNAKVNITGALMFTELYFAQFLEGPGDEIDALFKRIRRDPRHERLDIVRESVQEVRVFPGWSMAYSGPHLFVGSQFSAFTALAGQRERARAADHLIATMAALVQAGRSTFN